VPNSARII